MKTFLIVLVMSAVLLSGQTAFAAADLGPADPYGKEGKFSLGLGYSYYDSEWKTDNEEIPVKDFKRNYGYVQLNYAFTAAWEAYLRGGFANATFTTETLGEPFNNPIEFSAGFTPAIGLGFKGLAYNGDKWDVGPFVQYNIYSEYKELYEDAAGSFYLSAEMTYSSMWDLAVGAALSYESDFAVITLAPYAYWSMADGKLVKTVTQNNETETETDTAKLEEKNVIGGMFGVMVPMSEEFNFNVEAQYQSGLSFSVSIVRLFGN